MLVDIQRRIDSVEHWELLTLMILTCTAVVLLYVIGLVFA